MSLIEVGYGTLINDEVILTLSLKPLLSLSLNNMIYMGSIKPSNRDQCGYRGLITFQEQINSNNYKANDSLIDNFVRPIPPPNKKVYCISKMEVLINLL